MSANLPACGRPCADCPWRTDVPPGKFTPERFRALAHTSYDMAITIFACHNSADGREVACAGFLERGADHNLAVRLAMLGRLERMDRSGGLQLHPDYRAMAVANGVDPDDPSLGPCR